MTTTGIKAGAVVIDVNDLEAEARFWTTLLGSDATASEGEWVDVATLGAGGPVLSLQKVPETKSVKNRLHLDLIVDDFAVTSRLAYDLGARSVSELHEPSNPWQVFADPEGNEFCLISADSPDSSD